MDEGATGAGTAEAATASHHRGTNQSGMRDHNQRVVLSLLRERGGLAKTEIARLTNLSAQTASVIMRELEEDGLIVRGEPQRGKIGQPSIPLSLNPGGAFFLGLKVGRRSAECVLIDFVGTVRAMRTNAYGFPTPDGTVAFARQAVRELFAELTEAEGRRIAGLGAAIPFELWNWAEQAGAPEDAMNAWRTSDLGAILRQEFSFPVYVQNDASSACGAELVFGALGPIRNFIYFYIGAFAGGGVVIDRRLHVGASGNAGALGSMPVPGPNGRPAQLIDVASLTILERTILGCGKPAGYLWTNPEDWAGETPDCSEWIKSAGAALAYAIVSAAAVFDFEAAVIDGWMPASIRTALVDAASGAILDIDTQGLTPPVVREGTVGIHARAIGGASLPLSDRFLTGQSQPIREY